MDNTSFGISCIWRTILSYFGLKKTTKRFREKILKIHNETEYLLDQNEEVLDEIYKQDKHFYTQAKYLKDYASSPIYKIQLQNIYLREKNFKVLIEELKSKTLYPFEYL